LQCFSMAIQIPILCMSSKKPLQPTQSNQKPVQYGRGTLGVHIWELTGHRVNSTMNVSPTYPPDHPHPTDPPPVNQRSKYTLLPFPRERQALPPPLLPSPLSYTLVPPMCLHKHVPRRRVQYRARLPPHLRLHTFPQELGRYHYSRKLHRQNAAVHGHGGVEHGNGSSLASSAGTHGGQVADAARAEVRLDMYFWRRVAVSRTSSVHLERESESVLQMSMKLISANRTCITSGVRLALLFPMLQTIDQTWAIVLPGIWMYVVPCHCHESSCYMLSHHAHKAAHMQQYILEYTDNSPQ
jgi:hypothetical protein